MIEPTEEQWYQDEDEDIHSFLSGALDDAVDCPEDEHVGTD